MTKNQATKVERIFQFLSELRETTLGPAWSKVPGSVATKHGINSDYFSTAVSAKVIERNPDKRGMYRWVNETQVSHQMAHDLWKHHTVHTNELNKIRSEVAKRTKKLSNPVMAATKHATITATATDSRDIRSFNDAILINDLRRRGYTGTIIPPKPQAIQL